MLGCYLRSPSLLNDYEEVTESIGIEIVVVNPNKLLALVSLSWNNSGLEFKIKTFICLEESSLSLELKAPRTENSPLKMPKVFVFRFFFIRIILCLNVHHCDFLAPSVAVRLERHFCSIGFTERCCGNFLPAVSSGKA